MSTKISDVIKFWRELSPRAWDVTNDLLHYGSMDAPAEKIAVCFKITLENLREMAEWGAQLIITHEPLYPTYDSYIREDESCFVVQEIHRLLTENGIGVFRLHDHAHYALDDFIHMGYLRDTGLCENIASRSDFLCMGFREYELKEPMTPRQIAILSKERLELPHARIAGNADSPVTRIILALGGIGAGGYRFLSGTDAELVITGESDELCTAFFVNDAVRMGQKKSVMCFGHCESERNGMKYLAEWMDKETDACVKYFHTADTYTII